MELFSKINRYGIKSFRGSKELFKWWCLVLMLSNLGLNFAQQFQIDSVHFYRSQDACKVYSYYYDKEHSFEWKGGCEQGFAHGLGTLTVTRKESLIAELKGVFKKGVPQGNFKVNMPWGEQWDVPFIDGRMWGIGTCMQTDGEIYEGEMRDFLCQGKGRMTLSNGVLLWGTFKESEIWTGKVVNLKGDTLIFYKGERAFKSFTYPEYKPALNTDLTEYFDEYGMRCSKAQAKWYRKIRFKEEHIPDGTVQDFYINGQLYQKCRYTYVDYTDDELSIFGPGPYVLYYPNGQIKIEGNIGQTSKFVGRLNYYYENGNYKRIANYSPYGLLHGHQAAFTEEGRLVEYSSYSNNVEKNGKRYFIDSDQMWQLVKCYNKEDFESNDDFWLSDKEQAYKELMTSGLYVSSQKGSSYIRYLPLDVDLNQNIALHLEFGVLKSQLKKGAYLGLILDYKDANHFTALEFNDKDELSVVRHSFDKVEILKSAVLDKKNQNLQKKLAHLIMSVYFLKDQLSCYVNGVEQFNLPYPEFSYDYFGVICSGDGAFNLISLETHEYFSREESMDYNDFIERKVINPNPSDYDSNGSGFFLNRSGHFVTNYHVVAGASNIEVKVYLKGKIEKFPAKVLIQDKVNDLVILKVDQHGFDLGTDVPYSINYNTVEVGEEVFTLGYPLVDVMGSEVKFTDGKISAKTGLEGDITTYQVSTPIQPGNSGGPLITEKTGEVIGIVSSTLNRSDYQAENVNFAIKSNLLKNLIESSPEPISLQGAKTIMDQKLSDRISSYTPFMVLVLVTQ